MALLPPSLVPGGEEIGHRDAPTAGTPRGNILKRPVDLVLAVIRLRDDSRNGAAMAGNDEGFPGLHVVEETWKMSFCFGRLDFSHRFDQSIRLVQE